MTSNKEQEIAVTITEENIIRKINDIEKQNSLLLEQITDLSMLVYSQANQLKENKRIILEEFKGFKSLSTQRAMSGIFNKLFGELIEHINRLDELLDTHGLEDNPWIESITAVRDHFESILRDWGCISVHIETGTEKFDPEIHESIETNGVEIPELTPENTIVKVVRRGWMIHDHILQYPQVIVS